MKHQLQVTVRTYKAQPENQTRTYVFDSEQGFSWTFKDRFIEVVNCTTMKIEAKCFPYESVLSFHVKGDSSK